MLAINWSRLCTKIAHWIRFDKGKGIIVDDREKMITIIGPPPFKSHRKVVKYGTDVILQLRPNLTIAIDFSVGKVYHSDLYRIPLAAVPIHIAAKDYGWIKIRNIPEKLTKMTNDGWDHCIWTIAGLGHLSITPLRQMYDSETLQR